VRNCINGVMSARIGAGKVSAAGGVRNWVDAISELIEFPILVSK
jgi:hypothetical protein